MPAPVDATELMGAAAEAEQRGQSSPALAFLRTVCPRVQLDKWGQPLPLSDPDQARIDRLYAVALDPAGRGQALIRSGTLDPGEAECLAVTAPQAYGELAAGARLEMAQTPPPYAQWAEQTLSILFGEPAAKAYQEPPQQPASQGKPSGGKDDQDTGATPADRREISVRQRKAS
jgi:hypothetical protein